MQKLKTAKLTDELKLIQKRWIESDRQTQDTIYYREFAPRFAPIFSELPLHGWSEKNTRFRALISVLGFSWQPVALMAAWARPEYMLLIGTRETLHIKVDGDSVRDAIEQVSGLSGKLLSFRQIEAEDELTIYKEARKFISDYDLKPHEIAVDPTGGKKSMSISAGLAGFLSGAWIVYVDYGDYHPVKRIPLAGTEYPRLLDNPLEVFGDLEFEKFWAAFRNGNFEEAGHIAKDLSMKLYESREADALVYLARGYGAWHGFQFDTALNSLERLKEHLERFGRLGRWHWSDKILNILSTHLPLLIEIVDLTRKICKGEKPGSLEDGLPLVLNHLSAAQRALTYHQTGVAILLAYATLERYVDLALWTCFNLDDENPDFSMVDFDIEKFHELGMKMYGRESYKRSDPAGPIGLSLGVQLLATLKPELMPVEFLGNVSKLMQHRNRCEYEHGLRPYNLKSKDVDGHIKGVCKLFDCALKPLQINVEKELSRYRFPDL